MNKNITTAILVAITVLCALLGIAQKCTINRLRSLEQYTDSISQQLLETQASLWTLEEWTNYQQQDIDTICTHIHLPLYDVVEMANQNCPDCND